MLFKSNIKDMKIDSRNKWRKIIHYISTDSSTDAYYQDLMWNLIDSSIATRSIEIYNFQFSRSKIRSRFKYLFRASFLTTLNIYNTYLKAVIHRYRDQETYFLCVKLLCLYVIGFCNQVLHDLHCWWSEELCN